MTCVFDVVQIIFFLFIIFLNYTDFDPLLLGAGDQSLFTSLYTSLAQQLPREPMEWRR